MSNNTFAGFTFPVTDGNDIYQIDELESLVRDHADGEVFIEADDNGCTIRVCQQGYNPAIGSGWTEIEAWQDAAREILNGNNGRGYSNGDGWNDLASAREALKDNEGEELESYFRIMVETLEAAQQVAK